MTLTTGPVPVTAAVPVALAKERVGPNRPREPDHGPGRGPRRSVGGGRSAASCTWCWTCGPRRRALLLVVAWPLRRGARRRVRPHGHRHARRPGPGPAPGRRLAGCRPVGRAGRGAERGQRRRPAAGRGDPAPRHGAAGRDRHVPLGCGRSRPRGDRCPSSWSGTAPACGRCWTRRTAVAPGRRSTRWPSACRNPLDDRDLEQLAEAWPVPVLMGIEDQLLVAVRTHGAGAVVAVPGPHVGHAELRRWGAWLQDLGVDLLVSSGLRDVARGRLGVHDAGWSRPGPRAAGAAVRRGRCGSRASWTGWWRPGCWWCSAPSWVC